MTDKKVVPFPGRPQATRDPIAEAWRAMWEGEVKNGLPVLNQHESPPGAMAFPSGPNAPAANRWREEARVELAGFKAAGGKLVEQLTGDFRRAGRSIRTTQNYAKVAGCPQRTLTTCLARLEEVGAIQRVWWRDPEGGLIRVIFPMTRVIAGGSPDVVERVLRPWSDHEIVDCFDYVRAVLSLGRPTTPPLSKGQPELIEKWMDGLVWMWARHPARPKKSPEQEIAEFREFVEQCQEVMADIPHEGNRHE